ncbi:hypothetical protein BOX15_Mlig000887g6, partial [Macrostomum lignano]
EEGEPVQLTQHALFDLIQRGSYRAMIDALDNPIAHPPEVIAQLMSGRSELGKSPLDTAVFMCRQEIVKDLVLNRGADVNATNAEGYTAMHLAAAWRNAEALKIIYAQGGDIQRCSRFGERPIEVAQRYGNSECVDFLQWAEARDAFAAAIRQMRETLADTEKLQGRLNKDERKQADLACTEREQWLQGAQDATTQNFIAMRLELEDQFAPIYIKLSEPLPEKTK